MRINESYIHIAMRQYLRNEGWQLIAGQFAGGSDDELSILNIVDPIIAKDKSPDPRGHSKGKFVPDLVAYKNGKILIVEAKPSFSLEDRSKLIELLTNKRAALLLSLNKFLLDKKMNLTSEVTELEFVPCLAFSHKSKINIFDNNFSYLLIKSFDEVTYIENTNQFT